MSYTIYSTYKIIRLISFIRAFLAINAIGAGDFAPACTYPRKCNHFSSIRKIFAKIHKNAKVSIVLSVLSVRVRSIFLAYYAFYKIFLLILPKPVLDLGRNSHCRLSSAINPILLIESELQLQHNAYEINYPISACRVCSGSSHAIFRRLRTCEREFRPHEVCAA